MLGCRGALSHTGGPDSQGKLGEPPIHLHLRKRKLGFSEAQVTTPPRQGQPALTGSPIPQIQSPYFSGLS